MNHVLVDLCQDLVSTSTRPTELIVRDRAFLLPKLRLSVVRQHLHLDRHALSTQRRQS